MSIQQDDELYSWQMARRHPAFGPLMRLGPLKRDHEKFIVLCAVAKVLWRDTFEAQSSLGVVTLALDLER